MYGLGKSDTARFVATRSYSVADSASRKFAGAVLSPAAWVLAVVGGLTALRLGVLYATGFELYGDEAQYWFYGEELGFGYYSKPPLVPWIIAGTTAVCGQGEFCVRLASPLLHGLTAIVIYALGRDLFGARTGVWSAIVYATLPGVSYSSGIISTDVPLLFFWALGLLALNRIFAEPAGLGNAPAERSRRMRWAIVLGLSLGLGLLSKYAMAYFILCTGLMLLLCRATRWFATSREIAVAAAVALLVMSPNLIWNAQNGWATLFHVYENASVAGGILLHPGKALEFFGSQFLVFGPVLFAVLLWRLWRWREAGPQGERLLLLFSVPIIALITLQALASRAHANWAAVAYVAASVLVVAWVMRAGPRRLVTGSVALHVAFAAVLYSVVTFGTGAFALVPGGERLLARVQGWRAVAAEVRARAADQDLSAIVTGDRMLLAELLYYGRDLSVPMRMWSRHARPRNHFELTRPFASSEGQRVLFVTRHPNPPDVLRASTQVLDDRIVQIPAGATQRRVQFLILEGLKAD